MLNITLSICTFMSCHLLGVFFKNVEHLPQTNKKIQTPYLVKIIRSDILDAIIVHSRAKRCLMNLNFVPNFLKDNTV